MENLKSKSHNDLKQSLLFNMSAWLGFATFINKLLNVVVDPVTEGGDPGEHWGFLVFDAALRSEADDAVHLPVHLRSSAGEWSSGVTLRESKDVLHCIGEHLILAAHYKSPLCSDICQGQSFTKGFLQGGTCQSLVLHTSVALLNPSVLFSGVFVRF